LACRSLEDNKETRLADPFFIYPSNSLPPMLRNNIILSDSVNEYPARIVQSSLSILPVMSATLGETDGKYNQTPTILVCICSGHDMTADI
jgi:hypothetical protein